MWGGGGEDFFKKNNSQDQALPKKNPRPITIRKRARTWPAEAEQEKGRKIVRV